MPGWSQSYEEYNLFALFHYAVGAFSVFVDEHYNSMRTQSQSSDRCGHSGIDRVLLKEVKNTKNDLTYRWWIVQFLYSFHFLISYMFQIIEQILILDKNNPSKYKMLFLMMSSLIKRKRLSKPDPVQRVITWI